MKNIFIIFVSLFSILANAQVVPKKAKKVYIGPIIGGVYGTLDWNEDAKNCLKSQNYSEDELAKIEVLSSLESRPKHMANEKLVLANKLHLHNYICYEIGSFEHLYKPENRNLSYKILYVPLKENEQLPEGLKPKTEDGFYFLMHRMSVKGKQDIRANEKITSQEELDSIAAENARKLTESQENQRLSAERAASTYTVTFILEKVDKSITSIRTFYAGVFVEIYVKNSIPVENQIFMKAEAELSKNVNMNGYRIFKKYIEKTNGPAARSKVANTIELSDSKSYYVEM